MTIKIMIKLIFANIFHVKIQHKTINLTFCVIFASIKLPQQDIPKNNNCLNDTIIFSVIVMCRLVWLVKKCFPRPLVNKTNDE